MTIVADLSTVPFGSTLVIFPGAYTEQAPVYWAGTLTSRASDSFVLDLDARCHPEETLYATGVKVIRMQELIGDHEIILIDDPTELETTFRVTFSDTFYDLLTGPEARWMFDNLDLAASLWEAGKLLPPTRLLLDAVTAAAQRGVTVNGKCHRLTSTEIWWLKWQICDRSQWLVMMSR